MRKVITRTVAETETTRGSGSRPRQRMRDARSATVSGRGRWHAAGVTRSPNGQSETTRVTDTDIACTCREAARGCQLPRYRVSQLAHHEIVGSQKVEWVPFPPGSYRCDPAHHTGHAREQAITHTQGRSEQTQNTARRRHRASFTEGMDNAEQCRSQMTQAQTRAVQYGTARRIEARRS
jgi:hypothetical protein